MKGERLFIDEKICTGCRACEFACAFQQKRVFHYKFSLIRISKNVEKEGFFVPTICRHCKEPKCAKACPNDAITRDNDFNLVSISSEKCTGCGLCLEACPWAIPNSNFEGKIPRICDFCKGDPLCVKFCNPHALILKTLERV